MSSEFHQLPEKIAQLAALTQSLRRENADLRLRVATLTSEQANLSKRMDEAHQRLSSLMEQLPTVTPILSEKETA